MPHHGTSLLCHLPLLQSQLPRPPLSPPLRYLPRLHLPLLPPFPAAPAFNSSATSAASPPGPTRRPPSQNPVPTNSPSCKAPLSSPLSPPSSSAPPTPTSTASSSPPRNIPRLGSEDALIRV